MKKTKLEKIFQSHNALLRDPLEIQSQSQMSLAIEPQLLEFKTQKKFWDILKKLGIRLIISREYEHFVCMLGGKQEISYTPLPHPSGIAVDRRRKKVFIAASRNPNQVYTFSTIDGLLNRHDIKINKTVSQLSKNRLFPVKTNFYPGSLYIHDLAFLNDNLYANAVGHNAVVKLPSEGGYEYAWWPSGVDKKGKPDTSCNHLQLNSISGGGKINDCFFTASTDRITFPRIGHKDFKVDGKGVVFSGKTRKPICYGLTRPHSARLYKGKIWLNNSGYGELGFVDDGRFEIAATLPGWTRGLCFYKDLAFVGVSRVLPRFYQYAPGLDMEKCVCGVFIVDLKSGNILASLCWPFGNQIFSLEWIEADAVSGFASIHNPKTNINLNELYYSYKLGGTR